MRQDHGRGRSRVAARSQEPDRSRDRRIRWVHENDLSHPSAAIGKIGCRKYDRDPKRSTTGARTGSVVHQKLTGFVGEPPQSDDFQWEPMIQT